jgi:hypothetical protein
MGRPLIPLVAVAALGCGAGSYDLDGGDLITVGERFSQQRGCPTCHQSSYPADGVLSGQSTPRPGTMAYGANLTPDHLTGLGDWADIQVARAIRYGVDNGGLPLCDPMPRYATSSDHGAPMTDIEAQAIVAYLRSLAPVTRKDGGIPASMCPPVKPAPPVDMTAPPLPDDGAVGLDGGLVD